MGVMRSHIKEASPLHTDGLTPPKYPPRRGGAGLCKLKKKKPRRLPHQQLLLHKYHLQSVQIVWCFASLFALHEGDALVQ